MPSQSHTRNSLLSRLPQLRRLHNGSKGRRILQYGYFAAACREGRQPLLEYGWPAQMTTPPRYRYRSDRRTEILTLEAGSIEALLYLRRSPRPEQDEVRSETALLLAAHGKERHGHHLELPLVR